MIRVYALRAGVLMLATGSYTAVAQPNWGPFPYEKAHQTIKISVVNGESQTLLVNVFDLNTQAHVNVGNSQMKAGEKKQLEIYGTSGKGHVRWETSTARFGDPSVKYQNCGEGDANSLSAGATITLKAPKQC